MRGFPGPLLCTQHSSQRAATALVPFSEHRRATPIPQGSERARRHPFPQPGPLGSASWPPPFPETPQLPPQPRPLRSRRWKPPSSPESPPASSPSVSPRPPQAASHPRALGPQHQPRAHARLGCPLTAAARTHLDLGRRAPPVPGQLHARTPASPPAVPGRSAPTRLARRSPARSHFRVPEGAEGAGRQRV